MFKAVVGSNAELSFLLELRSFSTLTFTPSTATSPLQVRTKWLPGDKTSTPGGGSADKHKVTFLCENVSFLSLANCTYGGFPCSESLSQLKSHSTGKQRCITEVLLNFLYYSAVPCICFFSALQNNPILALEFTSSNVIVQLGLYCNGWTRTSI